MNENQFSHCMCSPYVSEWFSGAVPASLCSVEGIQRSVRKLTILKNMFQTKVKIRPSSNHPHANRSASEVVYKNTVFFLRSFRNILRTWGCGHDDWVFFVGERPFYYPKQVNSTCLDGSCIDWTNFNESVVVTRIESVRPYLNIRSEALSLVEQQVPYILEFQGST